MEMLLALTVAAQVQLGLIVQVGRMASSFVVNARRFIKSSLRKKFLSSRCVRWTSGICSKYSACGMAATKKCLSFWRGMVFITISHRNATELWQQHIIVDG